MPTELQIIRAGEFVRLGASGLLDFRASRDALIELAFACRKRGVDRALLDLRELPVPETPLLTPSELAALVGTFREAGFSQEQRLAVLYRTDPHHGVRLFAFIGRIRGWQVRAYEDFEAALLWLTEDGEPERGGEMVPVRVARRQLGTKSKKGPVQSSRTKA